MPDAGAAFLAAVPAALREFRSVVALAEGLRSGRLSHALLIHGDSREAIDAVAYALAAAMLGAPFHEPFQHPDLFTLRPSKKARLIAIGDNSSDPNTMRQLLRNIQQTPNQGERKVALIFEADRFNANSANAFLKTLEEPPADTTILLTTVRPHDLLPTIHSRCFHFRIGSPGPTIDDAEWLDWIRRYQGWLGRIRAGHLNAEVRAALILDAYGLCARFQNILARLSAERWKEEKKTLDENLEPDEVDAYEVGFRRGVRNQLFTAIETATAGFAREAAREGPYPVPMLSQALAQLERVNGLLHVNLKEEAAIEAFLLTSLRAWVQAA